MKIQVNEKEYLFFKGTKLSELKEKLYPRAEVVIYNGFQIEDDIELIDGDKIVFITKNQCPDKSELESMLVARHTPGVHEVLKNSTVGIAGLGGLGSNVAIALARVGVGNIIIADYDVVEPSNLNRQNYFIEHIGMHKTDAIKEIIERINPYVNVKIHKKIITSENVIEIFKESNVIIEAFDKAKIKADIVNSILLNMPDKFIVASSGVAGYFSSNEVLTRRKTEKLYVVGDQINEAKPGSGLMAGRVNIAASHQVNMTLRILMGEFDV